MTRQIRVLHVDDDDAFRDLTVSFLEREGLEVVQADCPSAALEALDGSVDCVVSDYAMPRTDGLELLEAVRERRSDLPFVLFTGEGSEEIAGEAIGAGVTDYLRKGSTPEQFELLANRVERAVAERRTAEALRRERDDLAALLENVPDPTVEAAMTGGEPIVRRVNSAFETVFGYTSEDVVGENLDDFILPAEYRSEGREANHRIQAGESFHGEVRRLAADGPRDFILHVVPHDTGASVTRGYAIYTDITEQKQRERELARQNVRLDRFASVVSHDLRNPLSVAKGRLELARETGDETHFEVVEEAHDRMAEMIDGLLALARQGEVVDEQAPIALAETVVDAWETVDTGDLDLSVEDPPAVAADPVRLRQLLENLFRNAVEHADASTVSVGALDDGEGFYVADDGVGIPTDERDAVLESGYSGEDGTGFGLAIVDAVAEAHGWTLSVEACDGNGNGGARFEFRGVDPVDRVDRVFR